MLAIRVNEFGGPDVLRVEEVDIPRPGQDEILVRVMAAGVARGTSACGRADTRVRFLISRAGSSPAWW